MIGITNIILMLGGVLLLVIVGAGIRIVRPIEKGLIETLGKYTKTSEAGFNWIFPIIQRMTKVNITERMVDVPEQTVQTSDKLNTKVDAVVYYKVHEVYKAEYNVDAHRRQLTSLARTTLRAVMGKLTLTQCIQERAKINTEVETVLCKETESYGVEVLRVEVQRIEPPEDVQLAMNEVVKAEQAKISAEDYATATETKADGERRASIKQAQGIKQAEILSAEGDAKAVILRADAEAQAIETVNTSIIANFKGEAKTYKALDTVESSLKNNAKIIVDSKHQLINVIGDMAGIDLRGKQE